MELYNDDCLEVLKDLSNNIAQVFFCDLPYGQIDCEWDSQIDLNQLWTEMLRIGKPNCVFCFTGTFKFGIELYQSQPKLFRYDCVIPKLNSSNMFLSSFRHLSKHEHLFVFYRQKPKWNVLKYHTKKEVIKRNDIKNDKDKCFGHKKWSLGGQVYDPPFPTTLLSAMNNQSRHKNRHPTQKDPNIIYDILKYWTDEGDIVIDPTMGSGTTGIACNRLGLKFIGIEKDEKWFDVACENLECSNIRYV
jgi:DNA modification methylase